jgi:hypothetical protein
VIAAAQNNNRALLELLHGLGADVNAQVRTRRRWLLWLPS